MAPADPVEHRRPRALGPRLGLLLGSFPHGLPERGSFYPETARMAEAMEFDLLFSGDHLFPHGKNCDTLSVLSVYAGVTSKIVLGSGVLLLPLRDPVIAAKQLATIDYVSSGRLVVGVGVGGEFVDEWNAMEIPREHRGQRLDEYLEILRALWSGKPVEFDGTFRSLHGVVGSPVPIHAGGPPILVGGRSDAALRRALRFDGWCAYVASPDRIRRSIATLQELGGSLSPTFRVSYVLFTTVDDDIATARSIAARVLSDRYTQDFERFLDPVCAVGTPAMLEARIREYIEAGVDDVLIAPQVPAEMVHGQMERISPVLASIKASLDTGTPTLSG